LLRLGSLDSVPPGLTHDEANNVYDSAAILRGVRPFFFPVAQGKEPLYPYLVASLMALLGSTTFTMRLTTAFCALLLLPVTYVTMHCLFGRLEAILTTAGLAFSFWGFSTGRMGLRAITLPLLFSLAVYWAFRAVDPLHFPLDQAGPRQRRKTLRYVLLSGLMLGLSQYTYLAARVAAGVFVFFALYLLLTRGSRTAVLRIGAALLTAAAVAAPLYIYLCLNPELSIRVGMLDQPLQALAMGDLGPMWAQIRPALGMFFLSGDTFIPYNIPGRSLFDPLSGMLFVIGLLMALWRWRDPAHALALLWFGVGIFPAIVTGIEAVNLRAIMAQPIIYLFPALPVAALVRRLQGVRWRALVYGLIAILLMVGGSEAAHAYFVTWANDRDVRAHYHVELVEVGTYLNSQSSEGPVAVSGIFPGEFHDPRVVTATMTHEVAPLRWFDARGGLVFPSAPGRLILPAVAPPAPTLEPILSSHAVPIERLELRSNDLVPYVEVYEWDGAGALAELVAQMGQRPVYWSPAETFPAESPLEVFQPLSLPVPVGEQLALLGYNLSSTTIPLGGELEALTLWMVEEGIAGATEGEVVLFTHLLEPSGSVIAQVDRLDTPSWSWHAGDAFLQIHRLVVPEDLAPGLYPVQVGAYLRQTPHERVPVEVGPGETHHRILLAIVEVREP
jgi:hypothetical protein